MATIQGAYELYRDGLITRDALMNIIDGFKAQETGKPMPTPISQTPQNPTFQGATEGQIRYIKFLQKQGKIPYNISLELTKTEAQVIISTALGKDDKPLKNSPHKVIEEIRKEIKSEPGRKPSGKDFIINGIYYQNPYEVEFNPNKTCKECSTFHIAHEIENKVWEIANCDGKYKSEEKQPPKEIISVDEDGEMKEYGKETFIDELPQENKELEDLYKDITDQY